MIENTAESELIFRSRAKLHSYYHGEMDANKFKQWFTTQFIPFLRPQSVIVMDNASYHSFVINKAPSSNTKKADILEWLFSKNISCEATQTRVELLNLVKMIKPRFKEYDLDTIAKSHGHMVVRLPPYHCQYNPIELLWAQIKKDVANRNNTFKIADVELLCEEAIQRVDVETWAKSVRHAEEFQERDFSKECVRDAVMEPIIINLQSDSDSEDSSDEESDE